MKTLFERMSEAQREPSTDREKIEAVARATLDDEAINKEARKRMMRDVTGQFYHHHLTRVAFEAGTRAAIEALSQGWRSEAMPQDEVEAMVKRSTAHARQLRDFWAQDGGTSIHLVAADNLDEQSALLTRLSAQLKAAREALEAYLRAENTDRDADWEHAADLADAALKGSQGEPPTATEEEGHNWRDNERGGQDDLSAG